jgi:LuxR family maltose regulon positive regulatory protein
MGGDFVHRLRLCELLDRDLDRPATLISAPAGFGKTTLLGDWLDHCGRPNTWLSLDERDGDATIFLSYVVAAVRKVFPVACTETLALLRSPVVPPPGTLAATAAADLDRLADDPSLPPGWRFILVLDDYHLVRGQAAEFLLNEIVRHRPRAMHLVVSTRHEPFFPLRVLLRPDELTVLGVDELRFTTGEAAAFVQQALSKPLTEQALAELVERSEGWGAGLRLAALSLSTGGDFEGQAFASDDRLALDYILKEVLDRVPHGARAFLIKTAILDRLCPLLCDAVTGSSERGSDGRRALDWLARENIFTFSLDGSGTWYRYHHLFKKLLTNRLEREATPQEIAELHRRASAWFDKHGLIEEALQHALAAGDESAAARIVEEHRQDMMNKGDWRRLEHWLNLMGPRLIATRPELLLAEAWTLVNQWRHESLPQYLERIDALMERRPFL